MYVAFTCAFCRGTTPVGRASTEMKGLTMLRNVSRSAARKLSKYNPRWSSEMVDLFVGADDQLYEGEGEHVVISGPDVST